MKKHGMTLIELLIVIAVIAIVAVITIVPMNLDRNWHHTVRQNWTVAGVDYYAPMLRSSIDDPRQTPINAKKRPWTVTLTANSSESPLTLELSEEFVVNEIVHFELADKTDDSDALLSSGGFDTTAYKIVHGPLPPKP